MTPKWLYDTRKKKLKKSQTGPARAIFVIFWAIFDLKKKFWGPAFKSKFSWWGQALTSYWRYKKIILPISLDTGAVELPKIVLFSGFAEINLYNKNVGNRIYFSIITGAYF